MAALFVWLAMLSGAAAESVTLRCKMRGPEAAFWGPLILTVEEDARHVHIDMLERHPGETFDYWDGALAPVRTGKIPFGMEPPPVAQFVKFTPSRIEVGFRAVDGELLHWAWFNRSALRAHGPACHWHSLWGFDLADNESGANSQQ